MHAPIAYTYEADVHCPECAEARFGVCEEHGDVAHCVTDDEGNEPGAIAPWDDCDGEALVCGTCGCVIREADEDENEDEDL